MTIGDSAFRPASKRDSLEDIERYMGFRIDDETLINGIPALHSFVVDGRYAWVEALLEKGLDVNKRNGSGETLLHRGAGSSHQNNPLLELAIRFGADVDSKNSCGDTALHRAVFHGRKDRIKMLLIHGADVDVQNDAGEDAIDYAIKYRQADIEKFLVGYKKAVYESGSLNSAIKAGEQHNYELSF